MPNKWYEIKALSKGIAEISIYGEIGSYEVSAKQLKADLDSVGEVKEIHWRIHSPGGSVIDGMAMYNLAKNHKAKQIATVDGIAASMASFFLTAMDEIHTPVNSLIMIHMPHGPAYGTADEIEKTAAIYRKLQGLMIDAYSEKLKLTSEEIIDLMNAETWYTGEEAVAVGFSNLLLPEIKLAASTDLSQFKSLPTEKLNLLNPLAGASDKTKGDNMSTNEKAAPTADQKGVTDAVAKVNAIDVQAAAQNAITDFKAKESARKTGIKTAFGAFSTQHPVLLATCIEDMDCTVEKARETLLAKLGENTQPQQGGFNANLSHAGNGAIVKESMIAAVKARGGLKLEANELSNDNPFRTMSLVDMARASLTNRGVGVASYGDRMQLVGAAFTHSSSDFGTVLANVANKAMLMGYEEAEETFQQWTKAGTLSDFKISSRVGLNDFPSLRKVQPGAEYKYITIGERGEQVVLATYGEMFSINRQTIINDDVGAFLRIPRLMGDAAIRTVGDLVYATLTGNPTMSDSVALFHATHSNLSTTSSALSVTSLDAARVAMRKQKLSAGKALNIRPEYLIVPAALETTASKLMADTVLPGGTNGESNPVAGMAKVITEARLDDTSAANWYLAAGNRYDTIEVSYLDGNSTPFLDQMDGWNVDGTSFKVRLDAGVSPLDFRTLHKATGAA